MTDALAYTSFLLASRLDRQRANFDREWMMLAGLAVVLAFVLLLSHWNTRRRQKDFWSDSPTRLFRELSRAHRLDRAHRRLMHRLGATRDVGNLAEYFIEPELLDDENLPSPMKGAAVELQQLRQRLFE